MRSLTAKEKRVQEALNDFVDNLHAEVSAFSPEDGTVRSRYQACKDSTDKFGETYLPHYFASAPAKFHYDIDAILDSNLKAIFPMHGPREHAKSSRARIKLLQKFLNHEIRYYLFNSETLKLSWFHIEYIEAELLENQRITADYNIQILKKDSQKGILRFTSEIKALKKKRSIMLQAVSYETGAKGLTYKSLRPEGCFTDDFEDTKSARNSTISSLKEEWIRQELFPALTGPLLWVGNMGHETSALYHAFKNKYEGKLKEFLLKGTEPGWVKENIKTLQPGIYPLSYRADTKLEDGSIRLLWPERYDLQWYENNKKVMGSTYSGEFNGVPIRPGKMFKAENILRYKKLPVESTWYTWLDPAWGRSKSSCFKCWIVGCYDGHHFYIVDAYCRQGTSMSEVLQYWYKSFEVFDELKSGAYENEFAQEDRMRQDLELAEITYGTFIPVKGEANPGEKHARIQSMEATWNLGRILFPETMTPDLQTVYNQCLDYPDAEYVDGPDSLEALIKRLRINFKRSRHQTEILATRRFKRFR